MPDPAAAPAAASATVPVAVWDLPTRLFKWSFALLVAASWATGQWKMWGWHFWSGYALMALVIFRILWGLVGSETARFAHFLRGPGAALRHFRELRHGGPDRQIGHNAAGGFVVFLLLVLVAVQLGTGLFSDDGVLAEGPLAARVSEEARTVLSTIHARMQRLILILAALHILAVLVYRVALRHDLIAPMLTGRKHLPADAPATPPRMAPAARALVCAVLAVAATWGVLRLGA
ncbi:MAG: cytochrome b/b6 domain-containing protein [Alphaproteobacteria bacterium]|nr:cytochrome b/b6 domain-containing protein [Alphaproteobacteria bacterium]